MTSVATPVAPNTSINAAQSADSASATNGSSSSQSGAVPAQQPARSYANATKTATSTSPAAAGTPNYNAKSSADAPVNGAGSTAQGGAQPAMNGAPNGASDHGRKPSMVISPTGSSGYTQNGGPVGQAGRPPISFGSMNPSDGAQPSGQQQPASSGAPLLNPRVISPAHSPSPIPQPAASGGRPPSSLPQGNGLNFGSMGGDMSGQQVPMMHERRTSSQSYGDMSGAGMRQGFNPAAGRGRGGFQQPTFMSSPGQAYRQLPQRGGSAMQPPYPQAAQASPYNGGGRNSPAPNRMQPNMQPQMPYQGYQQNPNVPYQHFQPGQSYDPYGGYYQPYPQQHYGGQFQQPPQSPRPPYPSAYGGTPGQSQPPFMPPAMSRSSSHMSERPTSSVGPSETPGQSHPTIATTPAPQPTPQPTSQFVRPVKKSSAIKITNEKGEAVVFGKPAASPSVAQQPTTPVIVSTPNAPTPPPRAPSGQHVRAESKLTAQETQNAFKEQVKKQMEEEKRKREAADTPREAADEVAAPQPKVEEAVPEKKVEPVAETKPEPAAEEAKPEPEPPKEVVKEAETEAEKPAASAASDDKPAATPEKTTETPAEDKEAEEARKKKEQDDALEAEIAEMEAREKEEEERERAYNEKKKAEKEAKAKRDAANLDEDLKRQEREAEERELARERERAGERDGDDKDSGEEPDDESKDLFAALKKPTLGPGASAPESGADTPVSEAATNEATTPAEPAASAAPRTVGGAQKPKPAHLKLETAKRVEPAEPTPGMQALKSARFLQIKQSTAYPDGIKSPNPALNEAKKARAYDKDFLLQFQRVFKEKPTIDWDQKVKDTLGPGDEPGSARGSINSARTPSNRQPSGRGAPGASFGGAMGAFGAGPGGMAVNPAVRGTTSEQRFQASSAASRGGMGMPGAIGRVPSAIGMGGQPMNRTASLQSMGGMGGVAGPNSPRQPSTRGRGGGGSGASKRGPNTRQNDEFANKMPLTAGKELKGLEKSTTGWTPRSIVGGPMANAPDPSGNMAPDMVQRKVKASLNKMTPEKFEKISDQILEIASQSKSESDGRTLRQVIQLTFEKACDEAHWASMYAKFCQKMLATMDTQISDETIKDKNGNPVVGGALFRKYLLNRCQEEFERGWQANLPDKPEGESEEIKLLSDEYYVAAAAKRRGLGLIQFIGQLYTLGMLTIRIMHECVMRLLNFEGEPDEAAIENLTTLLRAVGRTMYESGEQGQTLLKTYFERIDEKIMSNAQLPSRPRFMILDLIDLRKANWQGKGGDTKGPKTISQVHEEAAAAQAKAEAERQRQRSGPSGGRPMGGRGDARNFSGNNMPPPVDYRSSNVSMQELRGLSSRGGSGRPTGGLGPGGNLGPGGSLGARTNSRRGLGPQTSGNSTRTNTPPVDKEKKEEPVAQQNAFSALAALDANEGDNDASPPNARNRSRSPMPATEASSES